MGTRTTTTGEDALFEQIDNEGTMRCTVCGSTDSMDVETTPSMYAGEDTAQICNVCGSSERVADPFKGTQVIERRAVNHQEIRRFAGAELERMSPAQLLAFTFHWDQLMAGDEDLAEIDLATVAHSVNSASQEIEARWGADANDRLAEYFTASHASPDDMVRLAREQADMLVEIAKGEHDCGAHEGDFRPMLTGYDVEGAVFSRYQCRCGRTWGRVANQYFDPTESTVAEVMANTDRN